jgi:hypothetical protein
MQRAGLDVCEVTHGQRWAAPRRNARTCAPRACLDNLYDKVVPRGVIQFDDYGYWKGARKAVDEFLEKRQIPAGLQQLDYSGRFLIKPAS